MSESFRWRAFVKDDENLVYSFFNAGLFIVYFKKLFVIKIISKLKIAKFTVFIIKIL